MTRRVRDHYLPPDREAYRSAGPDTGRVIVIAPTRAACETIERAVQLHVDTVLQRNHGEEIRELARRGTGFGIVAATGTGKTFAIRLIAEERLRQPLSVGVVNREREATPETPSWNVVIVTTGIARRWFQSELILPSDLLVVDEIHQTSAELELCLALGKRVGCPFVWLSATVDPSFYRDYLTSTTVIESTAFDPERAARVVTRRQRPFGFLEGDFMRRVVEERRGVAVFLPTRAEVEEVAEEVGHRWPDVEVRFYHGGEPIEVIRPFLDGTAPRPFCIAMTAAGQSALNVRDLDTVVIYDAQFRNEIRRGRNVLTREYLGANEILQMAGRVHGRVENGEVYILTDRDLRFDRLRPTPPAFQLAGDSERVALTAAALGVDLTDLELPVPLDRRAYRAALDRLTDRGIVEAGRLTQYGAEVEAMPVDRAWGELLVVTDGALTPCIAAAANVDSLHRMTREPRRLGGLEVAGSDHLTAYNIYAEAVNKHAGIGRVFGLARHVFDEDLAEWAEARGVLVKAVEDVALGMAAVYRTLELELPASLPYADNKTLRDWRELLAQYMPFDLAIDEATASGEPVRVSRGSVCKTWGAVAGTIRYFADARGNTRASIEGTNIPLSLIKRHTRKGSPTVEYRHERRTAGLFKTQRTEYFGFELERHREPLTGVFPDALADAARGALVTALMAGETRHQQQATLRRSLNRIGEYWRRSGGTLSSADPDVVRRRLHEQLATVDSLDAFHQVHIDLAVEDLVTADDRHRLDALPSSAPVRGDRAALDYQIENGTGVVYLRLREGQARRMRKEDVPEIDRPLRFTVVQGARPAIRADSLDDLARQMSRLPRKGGGKRGHKPRRRHRRR